MSRTNKSTNGGVKSVLLLNQKMGDVSDPDVYASGIVMQWEATEIGQWAKENCLDEKIWYTVETDISEHGWGGFLVKVFGEMDEKTYTWYSLKFDRIEDHEGKY